MRHITLSFILAFSVATSVLLAQETESTSTDTESKGGFIIKAMGGWGTPQGDFFGSKNALTDAAGTITTQATFMYALDAHPAFELGLEVGRTSGISAKLSVGTNEEVKPFTLLNIGARGLYRFMLKDNFSLNAGGGLGYGIFSVPEIGNQNSENGTGLTIKFILGMSISDFFISVEQTTVSGLSFGDDVDKRFNSLEVGTFQYMVGYAFRF